MPPPEPAHVQFHGPEPLTLEAAPALQRFAVGALVRSAPFEEPHAPLTAAEDEEGERQRAVERPWCRYNSLARH